MRNFQIEVEDKKIEDGDGCMGDICICSNVDVDVDVESYHIS
jgi:hypothetical protein